jgi:UDP-N-acetylmuramate: L-alanyl-gamma-D-glutamyl-meso-diaminopimelate ligase
LALPLAGRHNVKNALAAIGAVAQGYGARISELGSALGSFAGVKRRQDLLGSPRGIVVYDDFAHHPTAVAETLQALRNRHPNGRLFAVFEPRSATACRNLHQAAYAGAFAAATDVLLAPLGRSNLAPEEALNTRALSETLNAAGKRAATHANVESIIDALAREATSGDVIALLSNGSFGGIHQKLLHKLAETRVQSA